MERKDMISAVFWFLLSLLIVQQALSLPLGSVHNPGPGMAPLILGVIIGALASTVFFRAMLRVGPDSEPVRRSWFYTRGLVVTVVAMMIYTFLFTRLGFFTTTFFLLIILFYEKEQRGFWSPLIKSALTVAGGYVLFHVLLKIQFPTGPWGIV